MTGTAWDELLDLIDHLAGDHVNAVPDGIEQVFADLCEQGAQDGSIDRELHTADTARWLVGLVQAHRGVRAAHPEVPPDDDLGALRVIVTRWLHPARIDRETAG